MTGAGTELGLLGRLFRTADPTPARAVSRAYRVGRGLAGGAAARRFVLLSDSADAASSAGSEVGERERGLVFAVAGRVLDLALTPEEPGSLRASGMVLSRSGQPVPGGEVVFRHPTGTRRGELDAGGGFRIRAVPAGPVSVLLCPRTGGRAVTDWFVC
ncbi:carboxypeptidase-like regulatory domain-containing protein [Actinopolyspora mortivallis]|uniref:carboxypeptidase-like regulatory domain-containing protein n=1 Tax=Actinopolyspora mortivallis TaxID=33906 RepID=UPI000370E0E2|nr:carboxypeptidase-like regulatory domain-containing protein [Actinopolyspora mortivallis]